MLFFTTKFSPNETMIVVYTRKAALLLLNLFAISMKCVMLEWFFTVFSGKLRNVSFCLGFLMDKVERDGQLGGFNRALEMVCTF